MRQGEVIGGRFEIERLAGSGGMGEVYLARDLASGEAVAVKVLHQGRTSSAARFTREAEVLAELRHPGIVRYVAHGVAETGEPYLAMEWLSGEDLSVRLERKELTVDETVTLGIRAAEALAAVHERGVVHRDLKPSNLFLVEGDVAHVKLLDFGITKLRAAMQMTRPGALIGTPGYMAPEQARTGGEVDARADVFALGCVLYNCLTRRLAFTGEHYIAVLAKVLLAEAPRVRELRPEVPAPLDALCARMLAKNPDERPRDGAAVVEALSRLEIGAALPGAAPGPLGESALALTRKERRVLSVILIGRGPLPTGVEATLGDAEAEARAAVCREAEARGGRLEFLADGSVAVTISGAKVATDQAALAARCALALREQALGWPMAMATGRGELTGRMPLGDAIDRAAVMLARRAPEAASPAPIAIDEVTAGLLDARFDVRESEEGLSLCGERELAEGARTLLGKPTACVGRDWELKVLEQLFSECVEEPRARAVLVTAPAGIGKSRLAYELLRRVRHRGAPVEVWIGRGDPLRAGTAFGLLGQALQGAFGIHDGEPLSVRQEKIREQVAEHVAPEEAPRVAEFLGEILGTPFPDAESVPLRAARKDAQLMGDQMRRAWIDFLGARCSVQPVLLVLEDLHWGDVPTVRFIDGALRNLRDKPWMVLGLARPEVHELFPRLWYERVMQEIRLKELNRKASARLARQVLGDGVSAEMLERLWARAEGNAFYLEELIRATAERRGDALPETVLAMVQSRLDGLNSAERQILRAASIFGAVFWRGAVEALLGGETSRRSLEADLKQLERQEWIAARPEARFQGERELVFRHALVREAAYGMLTDEDRALGHRLAGAWLSQVGESSASMIAEHFDRGGDRARAAGVDHRAAAQALAGNDLGAVLSWTDRALTLGMSGEARGELVRIRAEALSWRGDLAEAGRWSSEAIKELPVGSPPWYTAVGEAGRVASRLGQPQRLAELADELFAARSEENATGPAVAAMARLAVSLASLGLSGRAEVFRARIDAVAGRFLEDPAVGALVFRERMFRAYFTGYPDRVRALGEGVIESSERAGDLRHACFTRIFLAHMECLLGAYAEAIALLRDALAIGERIGMEFARGYARGALGRAFARLGAFAEARAEVTDAIATSAAQGNRRVEGGARIFLAGILLGVGDLEGAEAEARRAVELISRVRPLQVLAHGTLAEVLLARGQAGDALVEAREAMAQLGPRGSAEQGEALLRLVYAEALLATGEQADAHAAMAQARDQLLAQVARIADVSRRKTFLENVPENARTISLAQAWLGDPPANPPGDSGPIRGGGGHDIF